MRPYAAIYSTFMQRAFDQAWQEVALNGLPVSKESRARVEKAVAELGYVANESARALRSAASSR